MNIGSGTNNEHTFLKKEHYVYTYKHPVTNKVFWVGCGKENRLTAHMFPSMLNRNSEKSNVINEILALQLYPIIEKLEENLTSFEGFKREKYWIKFYGLENLTNINHGCLGCLGNKFNLGRKHSTSFKETARLSKLGQLNPMYGDKYYRSEEGKLSFIRKMTGRKLGNRTLETKKKISKTLLEKQIKLTNEQKEVRSINMKRIWSERKRTGYVKKKSTKPMKGQKVDKFNEHQQLVETYVSIKLAFENSKIDKMCQFMKKIKNQILINNHYYRYRKSNNA